MELPSAALNKAVKELNKLSGIGSRTALRIALEVMKWEDEEIEVFSDSIRGLKLRNALCRTCFNISDNDECSICCNEKRNKEIICVVEDIRSLIAIENTHEYNGVYHVLGGLISPINGVGPASLKIEPLLERIGTQTAKEVFFAFSTTMEGDTTMFYLNKKLKDYNILISTISRGISLGNEIEYTDSVTLGKSISNRISCQELYTEKTKQ